MILMITKNEEVPNFEEYFSETYTCTINNGVESLPVKFRIEPLGSINLRNDTIIDIHGILFPKERISSQICQVDILMAIQDEFKKYQDSNESPAYVRIICRDSKPVLWKNAQGIFPLRPDFQGQISEVRVDSPSIQISHPQYQEELKSVFDTHTDISDFSELLTYATSNPKADFSYSVEREDDIATKTRINDFEAFDIPTALGDGTYPIFAGYDADGNVCRLVCDFKLIIR